MHKCKFCKKKVFPVKVVDYLKRSGYGIFYDCFNCKICINNKISKKIYTSSKKNLNSYLKKDILYYLKSLFLFFYFFRLTKYSSKKKKIILDYGSGSGEFSNIISNRYNKVFVTDFVFNKSLYNENVSFIHTKKIFVKTYKNKFDIIFLRHVLEHIHEFDLLLPKLKYLLRNNGTIIIEVPNYNSFWKSILKSKWPGYFYPFHHYVFSRSFLTKRFKDHNFKLVKVNLVEPPIFGSYFLSLGINRSFSKILSIFIYPLQLIISKFNSSSEGILFILKK